jgi:UDP-N-acetylmuramoylalanine--D-glutamate ligase
VKNGIQNFIKDKKIALLGMGISNISLLNFLANTEADITVFDRSEERELKKIEKFKPFKNIRYYLGNNYLEKLKGFDIIFKTPIIRPDILELEIERKRGAVITSEMELFMNLCKGQIIGITGSDGKTTTSTIIYNILKEAGYNCHLGGNIGVPLIDKVEDIKERDKVVLELSSFQLQTMNISPNIALITNLSPNHLDVHKSMEEYIDCKKNIFRYQGKNDFLILNYENKITRNFSSEAKGEIRYFSSKNKVERGAYIKDDTLVYKNDRTKNIIKTNLIKIPGLHNQENYLAAITAIIDFVNILHIKKIASTFNGVEHRNEFVKKIEGVSFYNDSIGSSPTRTIATLNSFDKKVILIAGGYDKNVPFDELGKVILKKAKVLILLGETTPLIEASLKKEMELKQECICIFKCNTLDEAVTKAYFQSKPGDIVLFSPASASFDMFKNFEERGDKFKEIVNTIITRKREVIQ